MVLVYFLGRASPSGAAALGAARCGNFQLQLTTSLTSWWKSEVRSWKLAVAQ
ncbi:MAG: hypothetical protein V7L23_14865 [Nostoc sp.]|uniref:hypothetical protein n=1 Tax=Nostoc sp. TaxID=1180 RepID=UPI002FF1A7DF